MKCLGCHGGHGSGKGKKVRNFQHAPFAKGDCAVCHQAADQGAKLCLSCHDGVQGSFQYAHNHLTADSANLCLTCHNAHAAPDKKMLAGPASQICSPCHIDTLAKQEKALYTPPDLEKLCAACHQIHGSNELGMLKGNGISPCSTCHEKHSQFTHPTGEKAIDPRNGQQVTCVTCHDIHGTAFKFNLRASGEKDLCVQCHKSY